MIKSLFLSLLFTGSALAQLTVGTTVALKANNGNYVSSENGTQPMTANRSSVGPTERFIVEDGGNGTFLLKGNNDRYVSSENGSQNGITCNRTVAQGWERFTVEAAGGGSFSLKGNNNRYVSSENGNRSMRCNRENIGAWEVFTAEIVGGGAETVSCDSLPGSPVTAASFDVSVSYNANQTRDLLVSLYNSSNQWLGGKRTPVPLGSRTESVTVNMSSGSAPPAGSGYYWLVALVPTGDPWSPVNCRKNATLTNPNVEEGVVASSIPTTLAASDPLPVTVQYTANQARDVVIEIWSDGGTRWRGMGRSNNVAAGTRSTTVNVDIMVDPPLASGSNYQFRAALRPLGSQTWRDNINTRIINNVTINGGAAGISLTAEVNAAGGNVVQGFNNAIQKAGPGGQVNVDGTFNMNGRVFISTPSITIEGNGVGVLRKLSPSNNQNIFGVANTSGIRLRNLTLEGPTNIGNISGFSGLVDLRGSDSFTAENVTFRRAKLGVAAFFKPTKNIVFNNCTFEDCLEFSYLFLRDVVRIDAANKVAAALDGGLHTITNCTFQGNFQDSFSWDAGNDGVFVASNYPEPNNPLRSQVTERQTRMYSSSNARSVFYGNNVNGCRRFGISYALMDGMNIGGNGNGQANTFTMSQNANNYSHCVHLEHTTINIDVTNNTINCRDTDGVILEPFTDHGATRGPAEGTVDIRIIGNRFTANNNSATALAILANNHHRTTIINNTFTGFRSGRNYGAFQVPSDALLQVSGNSPAIQP